MAPNLVRVQKLEFLYRVLEVRCFEPKFASLKCSNFWEGNAFPQRFLSSVRSPLVRFGSKFGIWKLDSTRVWEKVVRNFGPMSSTLWAFDRKLCETPCSSLQYVVAEKNNFPTYKRPGIMLREVRTILIERRHKKTVYSPVLWGDNTFFPQ